MKVVVSLLVMLLAELDVQQLVVISISTSLKLSGDVESNLGPYEIIRSIQGIFNQCNVNLFGRTVGRQCACNALFSICWSVVRDVFFWKSVDLGYILVEGDKLHKLLGFQGYLNVEELPCQVKIFERTVNLEILEENLHDSVAVYGNSFFTDVFNNSIVSNSSGCILFLCSYAIALFKYVNAVGNSTYLLFDSHCRNRRRITGFSGLINFDTLFQIERYIEEAYQHSGRVSQPYIQVQFISIIVNTDELAIIQSSQISNFRRMKRQQEPTKNFAIGKAR